MTEEDKMSIDYTETETAWWRRLWRYYWNNDMKSALLFVGYGVAMLVASCAAIYAIVGISAGVVNVAASIQEGASTHTRGASTPRLSPLGD